MWITGSNAATFYLVYFDCSSDRSTHCLFLGFTLSLVFLFVILYMHAASMSISDSIMVIAMITWMGDLS